MSDFKSGYEIAVELKTIRQAVKDITASVERLHQECEDKTMSMTPYWDKFTEEQEDEYTKVNDIQDDLSYALEGLKSALGEIEYAIKEGGCKLV